MKHRRSSETSRRGAVAPMTAILTIPLLGMLAFSVDLSYMVTTQTQLQTAADSAALADLSARAETTARQAAADWTVWLDQQLSVRS